MKVLIIGGGKLGYNLAMSLLDRHHNVRLIEIDRLKCEKIADQLNIETFYGDGTEITVLAAAGISKCDCFIAVTGRDQDNLVASQLAEKKFMVKKVIARVNNPRNLDTVRKLGIANAVSSTEVITNLIEQEVESAHLHLIASLNKGRAAICAVTLPEKAKVSKMALKDIDIPSSSLVVSVLRDDNLIIPRGDTVIYEGDEVIIICDDEDKKTLIKIFTQTK